MMMRVRKHMAVAGTRYDVMKQRGEPWAKLSGGRGVAGSKSGKQTLAPGTKTYVSNVSRDRPTSPSGNILSHLLWQPRLHIRPENTSLCHCMYAYSEFSYFIYGGVSALNGVICQRQLMVTIIC